MNNFIINNDTVAILKSNKKTIIIDVDNVRVINKNIKSTINYNCLLNGSNYHGRKEYGKYCLDYKYKIPIYINKYVTLIQINSIRNNKCLFLILNKIINYYEKNNNLFVECYKNVVFILNISKYSFEKLILNGIKINNILNNKNNDNFV